MPNEAKEQLRDYLRFTIDNNRSIYSNLKAICGYKAKAPEKFWNKDIEKVEISPDLGDEKLVQAMVLGAMLEPQRIEAMFLDTPEPYADRLEQMRYDYLFMNAIKGDASRGKVYTSELALARKDAAAALLEYKNGNPDIVKKYAANLMSYMKKYGLANVVSDKDEGQVFWSLNNLIKDVKDKEVFKDAKLDYFDECRILEKVNAGELYNDGLNDAEKLLDELPEAGSAGRMSALWNIMSGILALHFQYHFNDDKMGPFDTLKETIPMPDYFTQTDLYKQLRKEYEQKNELKIFDNHAVPNWSSRAYERADMDKDVALSNNPSYQSVLLSSEDRMAEYLDKICKIINKTDVYEKLLNEKDSEKFYETLLDLLKSGMDKVNVVEETKKDGKVTKTKRKVSAAVDFEISDIDKDIVKKIDEVVRKDVEEKVQKVEEKVTAVFPSYMNKVLETEVENRVKFEREKKIKPLLKENDYIVDKNGIKVSLGFAISNVVGQKEPVYMMKKKNAGMLKISVDPESGDKNELKIEEATFIPYFKNGSNFIGNISKINNDLLRKSLSARENKYSCAASRGLGVYIDLYEKVTADIEPGKEYSEMLSSMKRLNSLIEKQYVNYSNEKIKNGDVVYVDTTREDFENIKAAYAECAKNVREYHKKHDGDVCASAVLDICEKDLNVIRDISFDQETMPYAQIFFDVQANSLNKQENIDNLIDLVSNEPESKIEASIATGYYKYIRDEIKPVRNPNGVYKRVNGVLYSAEGELLDGFKLADKLYENAPDFKKYFLDNKASKEKIYGKCNSQETLELIRRVLPEYKDLSPEQKAERRDISKLAFEKQYEANINRYMELKCLQIPNHQHRGLDSFFEFPADDERHERNKLIVKLATSDKPEDRKLGYEMALDNFLKIDPKEYDITDETLFIRKPDLILTNYLRMFDAETFIKEAVNNGVDIMLPKYESFRKNVGILVGLGGEWKRRITQMSNPLYQDVDFEQLSKLSDDQLEKLLNASLKAKNGVFASAVQEVMKDKICFSWNHDSDVSMKDKFNEARKETHNLSNFDGVDVNLFNLRKELTSNVRKNIFGGAKKNSNAYENVIKAIDKFRNDDFVYRYNNCKRLISTCQAYLNDTTKNKNSSRYALIQRVYNEASAMKKKCQTDVQNVLKGQAREILDCYAGECSKIGDKLPEYKEALDKIVRNLSEAKNDDAIVKALAKTQACQNVAKHRESMKEKDVIDNSKKAIEELVSEHVDFKVLSIPEAIKENAPQIN